MFMNRNNKVVLDDHTWSFGKGQSIMPTVICGVNQVVIDEKGKKKPVS